MNPFQTSNTTPQTRLPMSLRFTPPPPAGQSMAPTQSVAPTAPTPKAKTATPTPAAIAQPSPAQPPVQPSSFTVPIPKTIPSSALSSNVSVNDIFSKRNEYLDAVNRLSQAQQYSPAYMSAVQGAQQIQQRDAQIRADLLTGNMGGDTQGFAEGVAGRQQTFNAIQGIGAQNALQVQELIRQGNIAGAKALVDGYAPQNVSPGSSLVSPATGNVAYGGAGAYSDYQAQQTYFNLAQSFPDANVPAYNPNISAQQNMQIAQQAAANSPSFASKNLIQVTDAAGGVHFVNKNQLQTNADGSYTFLGSAESAGLGADRASLAEQQKYADTVERSFNTANNNLQWIVQFAKENRINNASVPIINQLNNLVKRQVVDPGTVAAYQTALQGLRQEYSQVLARGGSRSVETDSEASRLIPDTLSPSQLQKVADALNREGTAAIEEAKKQVKDISGRLNGSTNNPADEGWF